MRSPLRAAGDPDAFERYYADTHTALAKEIPGLQRFEAARGFTTPRRGNGRQALDPVGA
jgi:uncharacterized protein (TIGR02118 family)